MLGIVPVMRVNYTIGQLLQSLFVSEKKDKYRKKLISCISQFFSVHNVMLTSSGRCAIYMIVRSLPHRKVIVPAYTCEVAVEAVKMTGKEIVYANVDRNSLNVTNYPNIDADTIVIATHQFGLPCDIEYLASVCKEKGALLIEDCAGSLGTIVNGKLTGTFGDYGVFSFSASKTVQAPTKGGFIIAKNNTLMRQIEALPEWKESIIRFKLKQIIKGLGFCLNRHAFFASIIQHFRDKSEALGSFENDSTYKRGFYEWQASVVLNQFAQLSWIFSDRKRLFEQYNSLINNPNVQKPFFSPDSVNIRYAIQVKNRELFIQHCRRNGIQVGKGYKKLYCPENYTEERLLSQQIVYLPFGNNYSDKEIMKVVSVINTVQ